MYTVQYSTEGELIFELPQSTLWVRYRQTLNLKQITKAIFWIFLLQVAQNKLNKKKLSFDYVRL